MTYLIVEPYVKAIAPNIALMKFSRWCEMKSIEYQYVRGIVIPDVTPTHIIMSCIFTYNSSIYENTLYHYIRLFPSASVTVGGVFPSLFPEWFKKWPKINAHVGMYPDIENIIPKYDVKIKTEKDDKKYNRNKIVLYASRGCVNKCGYCAVNKLEGKMKSFKTIAPYIEAGIKELNTREVVLYDNNFTEHEYFKDIVLELYNYNCSIDIHGLHVDSFNEDHARLLSMLKWTGQGKTPYIRFSFDKLKYRDNIERCLELVSRYKIKANFFCYMLFNYTDTIDDFWWRIEESQKMVNKIGKTIYLFAQKYEPFTSLKRNSYISPKWTKDQVVGLTRLYTNLGEFIPITKSRNVYKWIGYNKNEFLNNIQKCSNYSYQLPTVNWNKLGIQTL